MARNRLVLPDGTFVGMVEEGENPTTLPDGSPIPDGARLIPMPSSGEILQPGPADPVAELRGTTGPEALPMVSKPPRESIPEWAGVSLSMIGAGAPGYAAMPLLARVGLQGALYAGGKTVGRSAIGEETTTAKLAQDVATGASAEFVALPFRFATDLGVNMSKVVKNNVKWVNGMWKGALQNMSDQAWTRLNEKVGVKTPAIITEDLGMLLDEVAQSKELRSQIRSLSGRKGKVLLDYMGKLNKSRVSEPKFTEGTELPWWITGGPSPTKTLKGLPRTEAEFASDKSMRGYWKPRIEELWRKFAMETNASPDIPSDWSKVITPGSEFNEFLKRRHGIILLNQIPVESSAATWGDLNQVAKFAKTFENFGDYPELGKRIQEAVAGSVDKTLKGISGAYGPYELAMQLSRAKHMKVGNAVNWAARPLSIGGAEIALPRAAQRLTIQDANERMKNAGSP